ncbi:MAG: DUF4347 domain-containing protein, partial [Alphaproteobacteria bacterium]|nr:DUF4347 domain-containing protein [Alphaproteobacteria bacterium]
MSSVSALSRSALIASKTPFRSRPPSQTSEIFAKLIATLGLTRFFRRRAAVLRRHARRAREAIIHNQQRRQQRAQRRKQQLLAQGGASGLHALEPRMVFDAAAAVTAENAADQVAQQQASDAQSADAPPPTENKATADAELTAAADNIPTASDRNEIAFIDSSVQDIAELLSGIDPSTEIIMLSPNEDGVEQIAAALEGRENIDAIHLLSHGEQGRIFLGNDVLDTASMQGEHLDDLTAIRSSLSAEGDILIYGCDFTSGEAGLEAAMLLGSITGADIAASSDATGSADLGGDWDLETNVGTVETDKINAAEYNGLLAPLSVTPVGTGGVDATTLAQQIVGTDVSIVSATLGGANSQAGTFSGATGYNPAWLAFDNGVVLSSGTATSLTASNTADGDFLNMGQPGTADFDAVGGGTSFDASYIDIKFVPNNDRIALEFVFGSDEYNEYVYASVNDAIGIWVDGTNIALNPTGDPIGIDTINQAADFNPGSGSQANDPNPANGVYDSSAPALYVNNDINDGGPVYSTSMDGFTRTLGANITVTPGVETTIRIGIADIGDGVWSSWLLIRGDSFQSNLIAENDAVGTTVDTPVTFSPTANDVDFDDDAISIINIADQPITAGNSVVLASGGTVLLNNDNTLTYTPPAGSTAPELFTYTITDSNGNTATAYVTVNVVSGAAPTLDLDASAAGTGFATSYSAGGTPVAIADIDTSVVDTDSSIASATIGISSSFAGDQLAAGSLPAGITVDTASSSATSIVLTGNASPADYAAAIEAITFSNSDANPDTTDRQVAVQITDTQGLSSNLAQATISISANQSPTAVNDTFSTDDATSVTIDVIGGPGADSDPDGDSLTVTHVDGNAITDGGPGVAVTGGTVTLVSGELVFTPSGAGSPSFTYTIDDGKGGTDQATVTGTVTPSNLPPVANDSTSSGDEDNDIPIALTGTDSDGSIATVSVTSLPPASEGILYYAGGTLPVSTSTPLTAAEAADLVFTPAENFHGTVTVSFTVTDDDGASSGSANEVITVNPVNDDPTAVDNDYTACEDDTASVIGNALTDNDSGVDADPDGDDLELIAASNVAGTAGGLFSVTTNGQVTFDPN